MEKELHLMLEDFLDKYYDEDTIQKRYLSIYDNYDEIFQKVFACSHQTLNNLFEFMNEKSNSNGHYNADESRLLLSIITDLRTLITTTNTNYKIKMDQDYINTIKYSKQFLESSGGSAIPNTFSKIEIIKFKPIFSIDNKSTTNTSKKINTEAHITTSGKINIILNKNVFTHVQKLLNNEHYFTAVEESFKIVRKKLRDITGEEQAHKAFNESNTEKIFGKIPQNTSEKDLFEGIKFLHMAIQKLRNEKAHTPAKEIDKNLAIHYIVLASLAYDLIDNNDNT